MCSYFELRLAGLAAAVLPCSESGLVRTAACVQKMHPLLGDTHKLSIIWQILTRENVRRDLLHSP